ncbi:MAG: putative protein kinase UbiB [Alphaproteobacteria bacterium MarineAlpha9_Bin7]|nr:MAG: putative protein kinase UbiB [Alphaproteobacteria bacterium MarineAlpha9_Bin7]
MIRSFRNFIRLLKIARTLARHNAIEALEPLCLPKFLVWALRQIEPAVPDGTLGTRLANAAVELGPSFIKFGQALSTRSDLLGPEIAADLGRLRDRLPPFPTEQARSLVESELGVSIQDIFAQFDDQPCAAASIAQVHYASTKEGGAVAVKILRPGIEKAFSRDIDLLLWVAEWVVYAKPAWRRLRLRESVQTFASMVQVEMDLRLEAAAASELAENFQDDPSYQVPTVDWARTSRRVLTTARVEGIPIDQVQNLEKAGHNLDEVLKSASRAMFKQVFRDGFFHGDPHPGNLFVDGNGAINAVDFGIMGRLDRQSRRYLAEMLLAILTRDYERAARLHVQAGYVSRDKSIEAFALALRSIAEPILDKPASDISIGRLLGQLFHVTETFGMETQPHLLLLQKVMVVSEGVGRSLNPDVNMWQVAQPLIKDWINTDRKPETHVRELVTLVGEFIQRGPQLLGDAAVVLENTSQILRSGSSRDVGARRREAWMWLAIGLVALLALRGIID